MYRNRITEYFYYVIFCTVALATTVPIALSFWLSFEAGKREIENDLHGAFIQIQSIFDSAIDDSIHSFEAITEYLVRNEINFLSMSNAQIDKLASFLTSMSAFNAYTSIYILDTDLDIVISDRNISSLIDKARIASTIDENRQDPSVIKVLNSSDRKYLYIISEFLEKGLHTGFALIAIDQSKMINGELTRYRTDLAYKMVLSNSRDILYSDLDEYSNLSCFVSGEIKNDAILEVRGKSYLVKKIGIDLGGINLFLLFDEDSLGLSHSYLFKLGMMLSLTFLIISFLLIVCLANYFRKVLDKGKLYLEDIINAARIYTYDYDVPSGIFYHNEQWCNFWKYPGPPHKGKKRIEFIYNNWDSSTRLQFDKLLASEKQVEDVYNLEFKMQICSGEMRWSRHRGQVVEVDLHGKPKRIIGIGVDITAEKKLQDKHIVFARKLKSLIKKRTYDLEISKKSAEAALKAKSNFLSTISHEIRTPLNAILGFLQLLEMHDASELQRSYFTKMKFSSEILLTIINDTLDLAKIEAGKLELEATNTCLPVLLSRVASIAEPLAKAKALCFKRHFSEDLPDCIFCDSNRLSQILFNLLNNAIKFTDAGNITFAASVEPDSTDSTKKSVFFSVADTGIGLSPEQAKQLFQPFSQADSSISRRYGGTGLGLAICRLLVEMMDGEINVKSQLSQGSTFSFSIPLVVSQECRISSDMNIACDDSMLTDYSKSTILVVEDNEINQEIIIEILKSLGISNVDIAINGVFALERFMTNHYDLIFMDVQMPIMDGIVATRKIRELHLESYGAPLSDPQTVPIIAMTANAFQEDINQCLAAGMNDYLSKPLELSKIMQALKKWLKR
ncbi:MAG: response regulator [Desulfovibrio sp.]|uniref:ATP-binding protein n=1 Tax=Desulfovibrio sp. TaxID=885 RepID=UPI00135EDC01|nr:ATP-binding protein [Desulfovibrio sp.]MTJ92326.1 response regulator [Desulfovibrio sp.]